MAPRFLLSLMLSILLVVGNTPRSYGQEIRGPEAASLPAIPTSSAVQTITELPQTQQVSILTNVKAATDGIQLALHSYTQKDASKMLKGIGDALAVLPGAFGFAGVAFSVAAAAFSLFGGGKKEDPVLISLNQLHVILNREMSAIQGGLKDISNKLGAVIAGVDRVLSDISDVPAKVVAELKLTEVTTMKDKFAHVQRATEQYAQGNLTREQMVGKCDDFSVAALFSELETILNDEKAVLATRFGTLDRAFGFVQLQLIMFYMSVIPLASNCNALKYSIESIQADGERIGAVLKSVHARASWYLAAPDRTIHVRERLEPFESAIDTDGYKQLPDWTLALSFKAYSFMPPHGTCFTTVEDGKRLELIRPELTPTTPRIVYAERTSRTQQAKTLSILQPEVNGNFDNMDQRGWTQGAVAMYSAKTAHWSRFPFIRVIADFVVLQAKNDDVSVDDITAQCRSLGDGYDRDGDAHSKDFKGAPWTIFCVKYVSLTLREIDDPKTTFLSDVQFNNMDAQDAWKAKCPDPAYVRDKGQVTIPSKTKKQFFGGTSTLKAFAVCLKWAPITGQSTPSQFVQRVWLDDSLPMAEKPKFAKHSGDQPMASLGSLAKGNVDEF